jgi:hypothetical protein
METGKVFQPPYAEAQQIIKEVSAGLIEFCLGTMCIVNEVARTTAKVLNLDELRVFRDELSSDTFGSVLVSQLERHSAELVRLIAADPRLAARGARLLTALEPAVTGRRHDTAPTIAADTADEVKALIAHLSPIASAALKSTLAEVAGRLTHFSGKTVLEGLASAHAATQHPET